MDGTLGAGRVGNVGTQRQAAAVCLKEDAKRSLYELRMERDRQIDKIEI